MSGRAQTFRLNPYGSSHLPDTFLVSPSPSSSSISANQGTARRINYIANLCNKRDLTATPNMCVFKCLPRSLPFDIKLLERHPYSSQTFIPMNAKKRYLVIVALGDDKPDLSTLKAFIANNNQGINYNFIYN